MLASWWKGTAEATLKNAAAVVRITSFIFVELEGIFRTLEKGVVSSVECRVGEWLARPAKALMLLRTKTKGY